MMTLEEFRKKVHVQQNSEGTLFVHRDDIPDSMKPYLHRIRDARISSCCAGVYWLVRVNPAFPL